MSTTGAVIVVIKKEKIKCALTINTLSAEQKNSKRLPLNKLMQTLL